jgi:hypothetical protein
LVASGWISELEIWDPASSIKQVGPVVGQELVPLSAEGLDDQSADQVAVVGEMKFHPIKGIGTPAGATVNCG